MSNTLLRTYLCDDVVSLAHVQAHLNGLAKQQQ
eukprot:SAG25_NODE_11849_length_293_cov_1.572165_1_plen_32_part_10